MKFGSLIALIGLANATEEMKLQTDTSFDPMDGYTCPPGPKSGWAERGDESCKFVPAPPPTPETVGGLEIDQCYQFSSKNFPGNAFRHRNGEVWLDKKNN